jgi:hypothetical protein
MSKMEVDDEQANEKTPDKCPSSLHAFHAAGEGRCSRGQYFSGGI